MVYVLLLWCKKCSTGCGVPYVQCPSPQAQGWNWIVHFLEFVTAPLDLVASDIDERSLTSSLRVKFSLFKSSSVNNMRSPVFVKPCCFSLKTDASRNASVREKLSIVLCNCTLWSRMCGSLALHDFVHTVRRVFTKAFH